MYRGDVSAEEHEKESPAERCAERDLGKVCGAPADLHCTMCGRPFCFRCARVHGARDAPDCRIPSA
jgi:hypothetical protein